MGITAKYGGKTTVTAKGSRSPMKEKQIERTAEIDLPEGDGKAKVSSTRGLKHWASVSDYGTGGGCTVEASTNVEVHCGQSAEAIRRAAKETGKLAEELTNKAIEEMGEYLDGYMERLRK